jgi:RNA polymerase sigma-54 factor
VTPERPAAEAAEAAPDLPFDISEVIFGPPEERTLVQQEEHEETRFENFVGTTTSLADHLDEQLRLTAIDADVRSAAEEIIGNVDEDGYLRATLDEIVAKRNLPLAVVEKALALVQGFDPLGVAARDLRECLLIQLRDPTRNPPGSALAIEILDQPGHRPGVEGRGGARHRGRARDRNARAEARA